MQIVAISGERCNAFFFFNHYLLILEREEEKRERNMDLLLFLFLHSLLDSSMCLDLGSNLIWDQTLVFGEDALTV